MNYPKSITEVIDRLKKLPGIGPKSAERIVFHLLKADNDTVSQLASAISKMKDKIKFCAQCFNLSEKDLCDICEGQNRDKNIICVVENTKDIQALEKAGRYTGLYHVLMGRISPLDGIGPDQLRIKELQERIKTQKPQEIILATSADVEGETTSLYLAKILKPLGIKITRIAYGIPVGSSLEFADEVTLMRSLEGRQVFS